MKRASVYVTAALLFLTASSVATLLWSNAHAQDKSEDTLKSTYFVNGEEVFLKNFVSDGKGGIVEVQEKPTKIDPQDAAQDKGVPRLTKWEYKIIRQNDGQFVGKNIEIVLTDLGEQGWELVWAANDGEKVGIYLVGNRGMTDDAAMIFKRQKQ